MGPRADSTEYADPATCFAAVFEQIADSGKNVVVFKTVPRTQGDPSHVASVAMAAASRHADWNETKCFLLTWWSKLPSS